MKKTEQLFKLAAKFEYKLAQIKDAPTTSTQLADVEDAIARRKALPITIDGSGNVSFDDNEAKKVLYPLMDKYNYSGSLTIDVSMDPNKRIDLIVGAQDPQLASAIKNTFLPAVTSALSHLGAPASSVMTHGLVQVT